VRLAATITASLILISSQAKVGKFESYRFNLQLSTLQPSDFSTF